MLGATFSSLQVFVTERDGSEGLACINSDGLEEALLDAVSKRNFLSLLVEVVLAFIENDFGGTLHVDSTVIAVLGLATVVNNGRHSLALGSELEADIVLGHVLSSSLFDFLTNFVHEDKHGLLSSRGMLDRAGCVARNCLNKELSMNGVWKVIFPTVLSIVDLNWLVDTDKDICNCHFVHGQGASLV
jgi:hypothetical protein